MTQATFRETIKSTNIEGQISGISSSKHLDSMRCTKINFNLTNISIFSDAKPLTSRPSSGGLNRLLSGKKIPLTSQLFDYKDKIPLENAQTLS